MVHLDFRNECKTFSLYLFLCSISDCNGFDCVNGDLDPRACTCTCDKYWGGDDCGTSKISFIILNEKATATSGVF